MVRRLSGCKRVPLLFDRAGQVPLARASSTGLAAAPLEAELVSGIQYEQSKVDCSEGHLQMTIMLRLV